MGILTLLRNAFGRSRRARTAEAEGAAQAAETHGAAEATPAPPGSAAESAAEPAAATATAPKLPSPSPEPTPKPTVSVPEPRDEHDLVSAAFDNVTVPGPTHPADDRAPEEPATEKTEPEAEPTPEPETHPEPEPEPEPETKPEPETEAETKPEPETEAGNVSESAAEAEPEATAEPAAADGEDTPQGPPAPDHETRTGGAVGNAPAEGEAEAAEPVTLPQGTAEAAEPATLPQGTAEAAEPATLPQGTAEAAEPATLPQETVKSHAPGLTTAHEAAGAALEKYGLTGTRAKVYLVLDRSASMRPYYKDGSAQALGEQTLALAAHLDPEATVHVTFFSTEVDGTGELTLTEHENRIDDLHGSLGRMGRTSYHAAVEAVLAHHGESADGPDAPALVIFQTDGAPDAKTPATQSLTEAAKKHPAVFFSFVAFGEHDNKAFDYLRKLKTDTASFFHAGPTPRELTDQELYEGVLANWRP
ncbi:VWA domain-containing protein [Streptomyces kebangsaanensis]|uniref:VWA domain-containing protein n=1 Tax=Streptomyces kebangsaanensis TaxID=864058 RepID=UPI00093B708A|nr:VWA domain-containing protein [Streptomyces kebangsaanensis]